MSDRDKLSSGDRDRPMFMTGVISVSCTILMVGDVIHSLVNFELWSFLGT